jgi:hypothetical protein
MDRAAATFTVGAGLANSNCYSLRASTGSYLRHYNYGVVLGQNDGSATFASDATFCARRALAGGEGVSLESYNYPGFYLRHSNYLLRIDPADGSATFNGDASFALTAPLG